MKSNTVILLNSLNFDLIFLNTINNIFMCIQIIICFMYITLNHFPSSVKTYVMYFEKYLFYF